jgi:uncharacterized RDD family membrane protein YckC
MSSYDNTPEYGLDANFTLKSNPPRDCPHCGVTNPPDTSVCDCGYNFAAAAAHAGMTVLVVGAGFWIRVLARMIDTVAGYVLGHFAGLAGAVILATLQALAVVRPGWPLRIGHERLLIYLFSGVGVVLYHAACEGLYGATLGKFFCGLRVLSEDRTPCRLWPAFIRSISYYVDAIFFGLVAYLKMSQSPSQQRHGDHWAHTVVVRNAEVPAESKQSEFRFIGGLALGTCAWGVLTVVGLVMAAF